MSNVKAFLIRVAVTKSGAQKYEPKWIPPGGDSRSCALISSMSFKPKKWVRNQIPSLDA